MPLASEYDRARAQLLMAADDRRPAARSCCNNRGTCSIFIYWNKSWPFCLSLFGSHFTENFWRAYAYVCVDGPRLIFCRPIPFLANQERNESRHRRCRYRRGIFVSQWIDPSARHGTSMLLMMIKHTRTTRESLVVVVHRRWQGTGLFFFRSIRQRTSLVAIILCGFSIHSLHPVYWFIALGRFVWMMIIMELRVVVRACRGNRRHHHHHHQ
jgi:hypothetical protein